MAKQETLFCETYEEIKTATDSLDKASMVPLKIDDGGVIKDVKKFKGIYNISQGQLCAAVVPYYTLVQHKEYFNGFAEALNRLSLNYTMKIASSGNRAFADVEFKDRNIKFDKLDEEFTTGIRLVNSYDKSTGLHVMPRFTRLACANGMILTRTEKTVSIKHHSKLVRELESFIEKRLAVIIQQDFKLQNWVSGSMKDSIEWRTTCGIIEKLFGQMKHREEILRNLGISVISIENKKTKKKSVQYIWDDKEQKKDKISRWDIYNAITRYLTHGEHITPHIESLFHKHAEKVLTTPLAKLPFVEVKL